MTALGDLTQIPVTTQPTQAVPALGDQNVIIYNQDLTNVVYASYSQWFNPGSGNSIPIQPLTSATLSARRSIYLAATTTVANAIVAPEGTILQPSPAQIAAAITLSGLPLVTKSTVLLNQNNQTLGSGNTFTSPILSITQSAYHIFFSAVDNVAGTQHRTIQVQISWLDSTTGQTVQIDRFFILPGATGGSAHQIVGDGPTKGDQAQVQIINNDTVAVTYNFTFAQSSRNFVRDTWRTLGQMPSATGFVGPAQDVPALALADVSQNPISGQTILRQLPLYSGAVGLELVAFAAINGNCTFNIVSEDPNTQSLGFMFSTIIAGGNRSYTEIFLGNAECYASLTNNGTATGGIGFYLTAIEL